MKLNRKSYFPNTVVLAFFLLFGVCGCSKKKGANPVVTTTTLSIASIDNNSGPFGYQVSITGTGFSSTISNDKVFFNGKSAKIVFATPTNLQAIVPLGAGTGNVSVSVNNGKIVIGPVFNYQLTF